MTVSTTAQWDLIEHEIKAGVSGNPYLETEFWGVFSQDNRHIRVPGFYDGDGCFKVRFCPDRPGTWTLRTESATAALDGQTASFGVTRPRDGVHGPVSVRNRFHFGYADGTPFKPFTTTCYAWTHQPLEQQELTLKSLECRAFNKMRMCVFPKHYPYNENEPLHHVYELDSDGKYDPDKPNFEAFRHFENQIARLGEMGIEADVIIFHPYDRWGHCKWTEEQDYRYLRYLVARIAAYRNVWWSLANEYDFMLDIKPMERWDRFFSIIEEGDPLRHPKSIHQGNPSMLYDHRKPWVDHVSIQHFETARTAQWRSDYGKPIVNDEMHYEGDIIQCWGSITAETMVDRFWMTVMKGGYAGHGETYSHPKDLLWWAKGGELRGQSAQRIAFLRKIVEEDATHGLTPFEEIDGLRAWRSLGVSRDGDVTYIYFGEHRPVIWSLGLPEKDGDWEVDVIDTWNMTITPAKRVPAPVPVAIKHAERTVGGKADAAFGIELPGKPKLCVRVRPTRKHQ
ncbi:DUF5060 domain-containing protein [Hoeflea sp. EC-HK425]|uniref:DUF5060 domain-containing protein n=1 Tax=Hoeflea sp. EC-HK425 TaxID=2038388 RepID=UPI001251A0C3|nr:DUF5060 domain-containing protein [Hoeflea sp. EC-HK425]VVT27962.1 conserved hypothetical protein [Hoeflea sp. EC-HK425]|tara:strand:+ start:1901 stop:3427 length:1527 start_codon:yes stop_codon:yes gene_type:complete